MPTYLGLLNKVKASQNLSLVKMHDVNSSFQDVSPLQHESRNDVKKCLAKDG